jgi:tetratricopeptide (TPR) repeat protein
VNEADLDVVAQSLRDVTVQIRHGREGQVVGTGFIVSTDGLVATCIHVVREAGLEVRTGGGEPVCEDCRETVGVYLPAREGHSAEERRAFVAWCPDSDDDVLLLRMCSGDFPLPPQRVARVAKAAGAPERRFHSYGYRRLADYLGLRASGDIVGDVEGPAGRRLLLDPLQLRSSEIDSGMSGSAVLDDERNAVVGVIAQTWDSAGSSKDRDTAFAVNAGVFHFSSLPIPLYETALPKTRAPTPEIDATTAGLAPANPGLRLDDAPTPVDDWIGRKALLEAIDDARTDGVRVAGLIGFGGEGKTSLARRWIDLFLSRAPAACDGVFWWGFEMRPSVDEFLTSVLMYMSGERLGSSDFPSAAARAHVAAGLLSGRRYIFILDGLETVQHGHGDRYGDIVDPNLRSFLEYFAAPSHDSFCLATSRAPIHDLDRYVGTYRQVGVGRLASAEGARLLRSLGVHGEGETLARITEDWDGHALTLSLIAAYLVRRFDGAARRIDTLPGPDARLSVAGRLEQMLATYDGALDEDEKAFLTALAAFRTYAPLRFVIRLLASDAIGGMRADPYDIEMTVARLAAAGLLRREVRTGDVAPHAVVRDFYRRRLKLLDRSHREATHAAIANDYFSSWDEEAAPTLETLAPLIEASHHACAAGDYDAAIRLVYLRIYGGPRGLLTKHLGGYETAVRLLTDFFPLGDSAAEPAVEDRAARRWILHELGTCLHAVGRARDAAALLQRAKSVAKETGDLHSTAISCHNLAEVFLALGNLAACRDVANEALGIATSQGEREDELVARTLRGTVAHLSGESPCAQDEFARALLLAKEHTDVPFLYSLSGIRFAEHLRRTRRERQAKEATETNLRFSAAQGWDADVAECRILLGELAADEGDEDGAMEHVGAALAAARGASRKETLIRALLAHGRLLARRGELQPARWALDEALEHATAAEYRLAEADVRVALARLMHLAGERDNQFGRAEAERAQQLSVDLGYHWGRQEAACVLQTLGAVGRRPPSRASVDLG